MPKASLLLGPLVSRRAAQGFAAVRVSAPQRLTSRRLFERSERSERSEFGAAAKTEQRRAVDPRSTDEQGALLFGDFLLGKQEKVTALSGAHPDAPVGSKKKDLGEAAQGFDPRSGPCPELVEGSA